MVIAIATFTFPMNADGVSFVCANMSKWFIEAGHQVHVLTAKENPTGTLPLPENLSSSFVHRYDASGPNKLRSKSEVAAYQAKIIDLNPDILIFHCWNTWPVLEALPIINLIYSKIILVSHGFPTRSEHKSFLHGAKWWLRNSHLIWHLLTCYAKFDQTVFLSKKIDLGRFFDNWLAKVTANKRTRVIGNAVESPEDNPNLSFRKKYSLDNQLMFLCIANYSERKNQRLAMLAYHGAAINNSVLVFIGSDLGAYGKSIQDEWISIKNKQCGQNILFLEGVSREYTLSAVNECDVVVLSSDAETQPIVLLEAMAAQKPFISTDTGCVSELKGGVIVNDLSGMKNAMIKLGANSSFRDQLGSQGYLDYNNYYSFEVIRKSWLNLIHDISD